MAVQVNEVEKITKADSSLVFFLVGIAFGCLLLILFGSDIRTSIAGAVIFLGVVAAIIFLQTSKIIDELNQELKLLREELKAIKGGA